MLVKFNLYMGYFDMILIRLLRGSPEGVDILIFTEEVFENWASGPRLTYVC